MSFDPIITKQQKGRQAFLKHVKTGTQSFVPTAVICLYHHLFAADQHTSIQNTTHTGCAGDQQC